jgi:hypothetical protein
MHEPPRLSEGLASALAAPVVVRSGVLMPLRGLVMLPDVQIIHQTLRDDAAKFTDIGSTLTVDHVRQAVEWLRERNVPPMPDGRYVMLLPPRGSDETPP